MRGPLFQGPGFLIHLCSFFSACLFPSGCLPILSFSLSLSLSFSLINTHTHTHTPLHTQTFCAMGLLPGVQAGDFWGPFHSPATRSCLGWPFLADSNSDTFLASVLVSEVPGPFYPPYSWPSSTLVTHPPHHTPPSSRDLP